MNISEQNIVCVWSFYVWLQVSAAGAPVLAVFRRFSDMPVRQRAVNNLPMSSRRGKQAKHCALCFLDASSHLYMRVCPSVGLSVCLSVGLSVGDA